MERAKATIIEWLPSDLLKPHPLSARIYGDGASPDLVESVRRLDIQEPLVINEHNVIISGHRRWLAAREVGLQTIPCIRVTYVSELDEREAVIEHNRHRQKNGLMLLNEGRELEAIEAERARRRQATSTGGGEPQLRQILAQAEGRTRDIVARKIGLGSGEQWRRLTFIGEQAEKGNPVATTVLPQINQGKRLNAAYLEVKRSVEKQPGAAPPLPQGVFDVIYADPPWPYQNHIARWGASNLHYGSMSLDELKAHTVPAAENSALFLWVTNPMLQEALELVRAWGFEYKTNIVWVKTGLKRPGSGFYVRGRHELLFICTRGSFVPDQVDKEPIGSVLEAPVGEHSAKPAAVYDIIGRMYPGRKCLELFARNKREGWTTWGNERPQ